MCVRIWILGCLRLWAQRYPGTRVLGRRRSGSTVRALLVINFDTTLLITVPKIQTPLTGLPPELFLQVLSYLPLRSVLAVSSTCKAWRSLALDNGVWWGLWQAREGPPRVSNHTPSRSSDLGHRTQDSFGGFGRRYRGVKDEGIHGLSMPTTEHENDGEQWDEPRGWAVNFDRANMRLKDTARLGHEGTGKGLFIYPCEKRREADSQSSSAHSERGGGNEHEVEEQEAIIPPEPQPISRQAPLMLDWRSLYRGRSVLEQRWRDPEGEPRVLRIDGHRDRWVIGYSPSPRLDCS